MSLDITKLDSENVDENTVSNYGATVEFLMSEGFIRGEDPDGPGLYFPKHGRRVYVSIETSRKFHLPLTEGLVEWLCGL